MAECMCVCVGLVATHVCVCVCQESGRQQKIPLIPGYQTVVMSTANNQNEKRSKIKEKLKDCCSHATVPERL